MGTPAIITFKDNYGQAAVHVFSQFDGNPAGIAEMLQKALESGKVWGIDRFEADEFAAGFIAANKTQGGGFRIMATRRWAGVDYAYTVFMKKGYSRPFVKAVDVVQDGADWQETTVWEGPLADFTPDKFVEADS